MKKRVRAIGISVCFFHADAKRPIFTGKTLQYVEQSIVHWVQSAGALALVIPSPDGPTKRSDVTLHDYAAALDGLVLHGGSDVWPGSYGEEPLKPEWSGDRVRDEYEIALLRAFIDAGKPVLGRLSRPAGDQCRVRWHAVPGHHDAATRKSHASRRGAVRPEFSRNRIRIGYATGRSLSESHAGAR